MGARQKDALVICLDVGPGMQHAPPGSDTPLEASLKIISMMLQRKIFSESKDEIAIVLFGTEETENDLAEDGQYQNIRVFQQLCCPSFNLLERVNEIKPGPEETDFLNAIVVSLNVLHEHTQGKKIEYRRLVLFTNFDHQFSDDSLEGIISGFNADSQVQLNVISPEFENPFMSEDDGDESDSNSCGEGPSNKKRRVDNNRKTLSAKPKTAQQRAGEKLICHILTEGVQGCAYSYDQAVVALTGFEKKSVRSAVWKCNLTVGEDLSVPCVAYVKTKKSALKQTWKKTYAKTGKAEDIEQQKYHVLQSDHNQEVDGATLGKGYKYGKDVVPFSKIDEEQMKYKTEGKCLAVLGFTEQKNILIQHLMDDQAHYVLPEKDDTAAQSALNAIIAALHNLNMAAVARYVYRKGTNPKLVALIPRIKGGKKCLVMVSLPFAEDVRNFEFPSLDSRKSDVPDESQLAAVDRLIDSMDLCQNESELYAPKEMLNPYFQWVYHNLNQRGLNPQAPMPPLDSRISSILAPNEDVTQRSKAAVVEISKLFPLQKQETKKKLKGKDMWEEIDLTSNVKKENDNAKAAGDASTDAGISNLFRAPDITSVGSVTPVDDFIALLKTKQENAKLILEQMQQRVFEFVIDSFGLSADKVIPCIRILREQAIQLKHTELFNSFMKQLKNMLLGEDLSYRKNQWENIVVANLSLIVGDDVNEQEAKDFLIVEESTVKNESATDDEADAMDLLDEL